jgi:hypothetical protein
MWRFTSALKYDDFCDVGAHLLRPVCSKSSAVVRAVLGLPLIVKLRSASILSNIMVSSHNKKSYIQVGSTGQPASTRVRVRGGNAAVERGDTEMLFTVS